MEFSRSVADPTDGDSKIICLLRSAAYIDDRKKKDGLKLLWVLSTN